MRYLLKTMLNGIPHLSHNERIELHSALSALDNTQKACDVIEKSQDENRQCPHCGGYKVYKHGIRSNLQRYRCNSCHKTFNSLTGTPLAHLRKKEQWLPYLKSMLHSLTIRESAKVSGINLRTSFLWRHHFTHLLHKDTPTELTGIVEADETYFHFSMKGNRHLTRKAHKRGSDGTSRGLSKELVCVFTARDRSNEGIEKIAGRGAISGTWLKKRFAGYLPDDAVLVTDGHRSYEYLCRKENIEHVVVSKNLGGRVKEAYHIQHVNSYHQRLKAWIDYKFHGVATKYLKHYLSWRHELEKRNRPTAEELLVIAVGMIQPLTTT